MSWFFSRESFLWEGGIQPVPPENLQDVNCYICLDYFDTFSDDKDAGQVEPPVQLTCGHVFGLECIMRWFADHNTCPCCRTELFWESTHFEVQNPATDRESSQPALLGANTTDHEPIDNWEQVWYQTMEVNVGTTSFEMTSHTTAFDHASTFQFSCWPDTEVDTFMPFGEDTHASFPGPTVHTDDLAVDIRNSKIDLQPPDQIMESEIEFSDLLQSHMQWMTDSLHEAYRYEHGFEGNVFDFRMSY